jgi:choline dehydrogenase
MVDAFDFIIIGSGAGGSTLAYRLSELSGAKILVLEAGGRELPEAVEVPWRWNELHLTALDWAYNSAPQPGLNNRQIYSPAGKAIGGSSSLYYMMHVRAKPADLDNWAYNGCAGWSFQDCLPFFQKLENQLDDTNQTAGKGGPITVVNARDTGNPVSQTFINACIELGYPLVDDFNAEHFGAGWHHVDIKNGKRGGVVASYLRPALDRGNVTLRTGALATKLVLEKNRCVGVEYALNGKRSIAQASREVIVCCGAIESPKLLMLSGIGNAEHLKQLGIPVRVNLPGVGENFHDHLLVIGPIGRMEKPGPDPRGNGVEASLFWGSVPGLLAPDLDISFAHRAPFGDAFFSNVVKRMQSGQPLETRQQLVDPKVILSLPGLMLPRSRGWVRLRSSDPTVPPEVNANYGGEPNDIERTITMMKIARDIYHSRAFAEWGLREIGPGPAASNDAQLREWVLNNTGSYYHFVGSCKMGIDRMAVVDPQLKVYGVEGLRIADGSIIPAIPAANTHTTIVMIGERAAEFIKSEH